jgi:hypothetical protein
MSGERPSSGTSGGVARVAEAIGDTGPFLHLHEIERLDALQVFTRIEVPTLVWRERRRSVCREQR